MAIVALLELMVFQIPLLLGEGEAVTKPALDSVFFHTRFADIVIVLSANIEHTRRMIETNVTLSRFSCERNTLLYFFTLTWCGVILILNDLAVVAFVAPGYDLTQRFRIL